MNNIRSVEHILFVKYLILKPKRKVEKGEQNDKMARRSKSKAYLMHQFQFWRYEWNASLQKRRENLKYHKNCNQVIV